MNAQRLGLIMLAGTILGSSAVMTRFGLRYIPPLVLTALRFATATLAYLVALGLSRRDMRRTRRVWLDIALTGIATAGIPQVLFTLALGFISSGVLTILIALIPIFTGLLAHVWLSQERLTVTRLAGLLLAFSGVVLLIVTGTSGLAQSATLDLRGPALGLAGAFAAAAGLVYMRRRLTQQDTLTVSAGQMATSLLIVAPVALALNTVDLASIRWEGWMAVGYTGLLGSFVPTMLVFVLTKRFGATSASLVGYVVPVVAGVLGTLLLNEVITLSLAGAAVLILTGVYLSSRPSDPSRRSA